MGIISGPGSFAVQFGDHLRSGIICSPGIICGLVQVCVFVAVVVVVVVLFCFVFFFYVCFFFFFSYSCLIPNGLEVKIDFNLIARKRKTKWLRRLERVFRCTRARNLHTL